MTIEQARVLMHEAVSGAYRALTLEIPPIAAVVRPGQFIHLRVPGLDGATLRRPFSVFAATERAIRVLYKPVGRGTETMTRLGEGDSVSLMGPLGNGFPLDRDRTVPVLVAGGYGVAPLFFLASRLPSRGVVFIGGASAADVLCVEDFRRLGWEVETATEDGSIGHRGRVTVPLDERLRAESFGGTPEFYACGPDGLLKGVGERAVARNRMAWLSLDKHMGCGVGACLACVQKVRRPDGSTRWARVCKDGPIFESREIVWL